MSSKSLLRNSEYARLSCVVIHKCAPRFLTNRKRSLPSMSVINGAVPKFSGSKILILQMSSYAIDTGRCTRLLFTTGRGSAPGGVDDVDVGCLGSAAQLLYQDVLTRITQTIFNGDIHNHIMTLGFLATLQEDLQTHPELWYSPAIPNPNATLQGKIDKAMVHVNMQKDPSGRSTVFEPTSEPLTAFTRYFRKVMEAKANPDETIDQTPAESNPTLAQLASPKPPCRLAPRQMETLSVRVLDANTEAETRPNAFVSTRQALRGIILNHLARESWGNNDQVVDVLKSLISEAPTNSHTAPLPGCITTRRPSIPTPLSQPPQIPSPTPRLQVQPGRDPANKPNYGEDKI